MKCYKTAVVTLLVFALLCSVFVPSKAYTVKTDDGVITSLDILEVSDSGYASVERPDVPVDRSYRAPRGTSLPSSFDLRNVEGKNFVTPVRDQSIYGACWAFSACSVASSSQMLMSDTPYTSNSTIFSPLHMANFAYGNAYDKLGLLSGDSTIPPVHFGNFGGNNYVAAFALSRWTGFTNENGRGGSFFYSNLLDDSTYTIDPQFAYNSNVGVLKDAYWVSMSDIATVKQLIMSNGACSIGMHYNNSYFHTSNYAYYYTGSGNVNHAVTVVGWDDSYSASNFKSIAQPFSDGAWIVKNSYGENWGDNGYFYLSYEDASLVNSDAGFYMLTAPDTYDNNYQYDGSMAITQFGENSNYWGRTGGGYMANVYTPDSSETLKAVSFFTWEDSVNYTIDIYTGLTSSSNPKSGTLTATVNGTQLYRGYHTVSIPDVALEAGEKFSVVVRLYKGTSDTVTLFCDYTYTASNGTKYINAMSSGQSFFSSATNAGNKWTDMGTKYSAAFRIKAFTVENDAQQDTDIDTDTLTDVDMPIDERVKYNLTYHGNGGLTSKGESVYYDGKYAEGEPVYVKHDLFTRVGYTYTGMRVWDNFISVDSVGFFMPNADADLYAQWERNVPDVAGLSIYGSSPRVIEPWGIKFAMQVVEEFPLEAADDYGMIVIPTEDYEALNSTDVDIVRTSQASTIYLSDDLEMSGAYYVATYDEGIYTYQLDREYTVIPFAVYSEEYIAGEIYTDSMLSCAERAINSGALSKNVETVLEDMKEMHTIVTECYEAQGITDIQNTGLQNVVRGSSEFIGTEVSDASVSASVIGGSPRTCEPWGITFGAQFSGISTAIDYGVIVIGASDYENRADNMSLLSNESSYIFSERNGALQTSGSNKLAVFEGVIQTYTMDDVYYAVPYVQISDSNYVFGTAVGRSMLELANAVIDKAAQKEITDLFKSMVKFHTDVSLVYAT